jgi:uncharacterized protein
VITNCHIHTFTHAHTPERFLPWPINELVRFAIVRRALIWVARVFDPDRKTALGRYAEIIKTGYKRTQAEVFEIVQGYYPQWTRFVLLPMDMTQMNAGAVEQSIDEQHEQVASLRDSNPDALLPFAAVDPRHTGIVEKTIELLESKRFHGIKLYPPTGYHPYDTRLHPLYDYADEHEIPVLTHCSRPASVQYRGEPSEKMRRNPESDNARLSYGRYELLQYFTRPDAYLPLLRRYPRIRVCLAHFGGAGDWRSYLEHPWSSQSNPSTESWLARILDLIRSGDYPNLWTDIAYTLFADDEYVYLLKVLLADERVRARVLFGSDFYVVDNAELEERRRSVRIRAVLGDRLFQTIASDNPAEYLGE